VPTGAGAVVIGSRNADVGIPAAIDVLSSGGRALDAVEAAVRLVEDNPDDHTVGYGGYPNLSGEVELDASIMDGTTRRAGAVGALRGYRHAITVARAVMERLPHVLVVGDGAARLAAEIGLVPENLLTPEAERVWRDGIEGRLPPGGLAARMLSAVAAMATDPEHVAGTVNVIARDRDGNLASAVSTSGWAWKYPGRLGDSPIVGAGNYADSRFGAAACTGYGELAIRATTARTIVAALEHGASLADAGAAALRDVVALGDDGDVPPVMHTVALAADGSHAAFSTDDATYVFWEDGMDAAVEQPRTVVA
jgi:beta-aspartyl-peptidase (threonine type)